MSAQSHIDSQSESGTTVTDFSDAEERIEDKAHQMDAELIEGQIMLKKVILKFITIHLALNIWHLLF